LYSYTVKKRLAVFPSPAGTSLTELSLAGNNLITVFLARESLVSDIPAGDGNVANLFLQSTGTGQTKIISKLICHKQFISFMKISDVTCYGLQRSVKKNELQNMFKIRYRHLRKRSIKDTFSDSYLWCIKLAGLKPRPLVRVRGEFYYSRLPAQDTMLQAPIVPKRLRTIINKLQALLLAELVNSFSYWLQCLTKVSFTTSAY